MWLSLNRGISFNPSTFLRKSLLNLPLFKLIRLVNSIHPISRQLWRDVHEHCNKSHIKTFSRRQDDVRSNKGRFLAWIALTGTSSFGSSVGEMRFCLPLAHEMLSVSKHKYLISVVLTRLAVCSCHGKVSPASLENLALRPFMLFLPIF